MKIKNVSPLGDLDVPLLGNRVVKAGEEIDVSDAHAKRLLLQPDNWQPAAKSAPVKASEVDKKGDDK